MSARDDILAATKWRTNAELMEAVVKLGYIQPDDRVIDLTFGDGNWWTRYQHPGCFMANVDEPPEQDMPSFVTGWNRWDYRQIPDQYENMFDVVVFDPPYVSMGGRSTSGMKDFMARYGLENAAATPRLLQDDITSGLAEAFKICRPEGRILVKCANYISSQRFQPGVEWTYQAAVDLGLRVEDSFVHVGNYRAQPQTTKCKWCLGAGEFQSTDGPYRCDECDGVGRRPRPQQHARNNYSVLWVFSKPRGRGPKPTTVLIDEVTP